MAHDKETTEPNPSDEVREIFPEFLAEVVKFEELVAIGHGFLASFQQALEFIRRPSIQETSEMVSDILKANETKRTKAYIQAGCVNVYNTSHNVTKMSTSLAGLQDHLAKAKNIIEELQNLMEKAAGNSLEAIGESEMEEICSASGESLDTVEYGSFMAVIYDMVKQDYVMQVKIVSSLNLKSSTVELDSYSLMWSLRPYVDDDIIHQALRCKR